MTAERPNSIPAGYLSPLERAKASHQPMQSIDKLVGITKRVPWTGRKWKYTRP